MLSEALESIMVQTHPPTEVVVSDNYADSATAAVVASFASRSNFPVRLVECQHRNSPVENFNNAFMAALGDLIVLLHDDDLLYPGALKALVEPFLVVEDLVASYGLQMKIANSGEELESEPINRAFARVQQEAGLKTNSLRFAVLQQLPSNGFMVRASVAKAVLYDSNYGGACDVEFGVRCASHGPFYFVPVWTSKYRLSADSIARGRGRKTDVAGYHFVRLCLEMLDNSAPCEQELKLRLRERISVGLVQAAALGHTRTAVSWLLGPYHRRQLLTLPGAARAFRVALACLRVRIPPWKKAFRLNGVKIWSRGCDLWENIARRLSFRISRGS
jgi:glycosyltransferase involved in cell wall biosynthesis